MLDVITRMLISAGIFIGTTYLPTLSETVSARTHRVEASAGAVRECPARPAIAPATRAIACVIG